MRPNPPVTLSIALIASLTACGRDAPAPTPTATPTPTPTATIPAGEKVSIIRDDVGIEREPEVPPMAPLELTIGFPDGGTSLTEDAKTRLDAAISSDQMKAGGAITLGGHTDSAGRDNANLRASKKRAEAVRDWLVDHGVEKERIEVIAFGEQNPAFPNAKPDGTPDKAGRAKNRRVEMTVAVPEGTPPAASPSDSGTLVDELTGAAED